MQERQTPEPDAREEQETPPAARDEDLAPPADDAEESAASDGAAESPEQVVASLRAQVKAAEDRTLRSQAELENFRKRVGRERADERRYASLTLMRDLLPVLDNLDRAIESAEQSHDATALLEGVKMVSCQLVGVLAKHDCVPIEALNEPFDPHRHEAILHQPSDDVPADMVTQVTQTGYRLHDRVVRPTQVIVSAGPATPDAE